MPDPPATTAQQPVNSGKTCCPFAAQKPCDVDLLKVKVEFVDRKAPKGTGAVTVRELETATVKRKPVKTVWAGRTQVMVKNYPGLSENLNMKLAQYDFVIDCFADFPEPKVVTATEWKAALKELVTGDGKKFAKDKAKISANAKFYGLHCERQEHGLMQMKPMSGNDKTTPSMTSKKVDQATNELAVHDFAAHRFPLLDNMFSGVNVDGELEVPDSGGTGVMFLFEFIASIFGAMFPKEVEVVAHACGKRAKEHPQIKNHDLRGLVRIFRKDVWTVGLKIPSLAEFKKEGAAKYGLGTGIKEEKWTQDGRFGDQSSSKSTTTTTKANGVVVTENKRENRDGDQGSSFKSTSTQYGAISKKESESQYTDRDGSKMTGYTKGGDPYGGVPTRELVAKRMEEASSGFDLSINRNGVEVPFKATLKKIKEAVEAFAKTLAQIQEMFRKAPQIGWKVTFSISALAGTIVLEFGSKLMPAAADGRYLPINYVCEGNMKLELINVKLGLSFGLDAQVLDSGLVLKIEGTVSLKIEINTDLNLDLITKPVKTIGLELKQVTEFKILAHVNVLGKTVAGAELSIAMGFEFKDGKIIIDVTKPTVDLKGTLRASDITVSGFIKVPWWWDKKVDKAKLLDGCDIHTFK